MLRLLRFARSRIVGLIWYLLVSALLIASLVAFSQGQRAFSLLLLVLGSHLSCSQQLWALHLRLESSRRKILQTLWEVEFSLTSRGSTPSESEPSASPKKSE